MTRSRRKLGLGWPTVLAAALGLGISIPTLGLVRFVLGRESQYIDPLLLGNETATWLPASTESLRPLSAIQDEGLRALTAVLLALVLLLVAVALVQVTTLVFVRASHRRPEMAVRAALGAPGSRLIRQLLVETGPSLGLIFGLGLMIGGLTFSLLSRGWPGESAWGDPALDARLALTVAALFLGIASLAWISPARVAVSKRLHRFLTIGGRGTRPGEEFVRQMLATLQIAASLVLLTTAALLLRGFAISPQTAAQLGFDPADTLTVRLEPTAGIRLDASERRLVYQTLIDRVASIPGVTAISGATPGTWLGLGPTDRVTTICPECWLGLMIKAMNTGEARIHAVTPGFFAAMGIEISRGREIVSDEPAQVAVINEVFAYRLFPNGEPLGKQLQLGGRAGEWYTIVGIVHDLGAQAVGSTQTPTPALYLSAIHYPSPVLDLAVRSTADQAVLLSRIERIVAETVPEAALADPMTMEQYLEHFRAPLQWFGGLFGVLAVVTFFLATTGVQAAMLQSVRLRAREIGIRMALGARPRDIQVMIVRQTLRTTGLGAWLGLMGAAGLARLLQMLLTGVEPFDPVLFAEIAAILTAGALAASYVPATRAASLDPQRLLQVG
jgi:putative ABC transport system permease protein